MTLNDIKKLQAAGVGADVLLSLILDDDNQILPADQAGANPSPAPADKTPAEGSSASSPSAGTPDAPAASATNDAILAAINKLTGSIQAMNIRNLGNPGKPAETADDILKNFLTGGKQ